MSMYKDKCYELHDCEPTISFMEKVDNVITAIYSRTPENALRPDTNCSMRKAIIDFDHYLHDWEKKAKEEITKQKAEKKKKKANKEENFEFPITNSTLTGFKVTLGTTLELLEFSHDKCNYDYIMTSRLNQNSLEEFSELCSHLVDVTTTRVEYFLAKFSVFSAAIFWQHHRGVPTSLVGKY
ncbi:uncharacterized protein LOC103578257 isoform X1 [Microplitis demolitor]|uniref:uncharacterized protein LOC103578257 isoform X1 n=1 Tax=Microplitis demolitor TaxID=69319 RepID=UPI0004CCADBD|nr:uncharacterized protein LOC103578257 isoform X1 [Microplitis demolitor]